MPYKTDGGILLIGPTGVTDIYCCRRCLAQKLILWPNPRILGLVPGICLEDLRGQLGSKRQKIFQ